jgi:dTDP-4-amino-4,6-dideoxygalactose transaminase
MRVPLVDLASQQTEVNTEVRTGWDKILSASAFIGGTAVTEFERAYAAAVGVSHCVGAANGTDALELSLRAIGVSVGDQVILPANSFVATAEAVSRVGATPIIVDVDPVHLLIDPDRVAEAVTKRTKAIVPVHLFGQTAPVERLMPIAEACGVAIVEDAAQSQGAKRFDQSAGSLGSVAATSFYPGKNLGAFGDAGAVTTNDPQIAHRVRLMGGHGSVEKYVHEVPGFNSRLDALQAVVLSAKLRHLAHWNALRNEAARRYAELLAEFPELILPRSAEGNEDVWHLYVVRVRERDRVLATLHEAGIDAGIHYPTPIHLTKAFTSLGQGAGSCPQAERAAKQILSLPLCPHITIEAQKYVASKLRAALRPSRTVNFGWFQGRPAPSADRRVYKIPATVGGFKVEPVASRNGGTVDER